MYKNLEAALQLFLDVKGIRRMSFVNFRGEVIGPKETLSPQGIEVAQILAAFETVGRAANYLEMDFAQAKLIAFDGLNVRLSTHLGDEDALLLFECDPSVDVPHLRMSVRVFAASLVPDRKKLGRLVKIEKRSTLDRMGLEEKYGSLLNLLQQQGS